MSNTSNQIEEKIFEFVRNNTHSDINTVNNETMLFRDGIFDSMGFVLLIDFLEENFTIKTNDNDLVEQNFESIKSIISYINRKKASNAA